MQIKFLKSEKGKSILLTAISNITISADSSAESHICTHENLQTDHWKLSQEIKKPF